MEKGSEPHIFSFEVVAALLGVEILMALHEPPRMRVLSRGIRHDQPQLPVLFVGSTQTTFQPEKLAKLLFFAQLLGRGVVSDSHRPIDAVVGKPLCRLVLLDQCSGFVGQYLDVAQRPVFGLGPCGLPDHLDVFDLLQRRHDLWGVLHHAGVHGECPCCPCSPSEELGLFFGCC